ncbi:MAG: diacylglycerol/lipid kinase family protein [Oscillospiraceae bacterium]
MSKNVLLIVNPRAGRMKIRTSLFRVTERLCGEGYLPTIMMTQYRGHARELAAAAGGYDMIICTGGDGTLNEVISGTVSAGLSTPIGYIPLGSTNDFAKSLGIPVTVDGALENIMTGDPTPIDVGRFNDEYFTDVGFIGYFSKTARDTPQDMKNTLGFFAYVLEGIKDLPSMRTINLEAKIDGKTISGEYLICAVSNSNTLGGVTSLDKSLVKVDDGLFEMLLVAKPQSVAQLHSYVRAMRTGNLNCEGVTFLSTSEVEITCDCLDPWTLDGESAPWNGSVKIDVLPKAARLILK